MALASRSSGLDVNDRFVCNGQILKLRVSTGIEEAK